MSAAPTTTEIPRFNHVALTVPANLLDEAGRADLLRFHEEVFGWTEMPTLTRDRELLVLRAWSNEQFVYLHASPTPMRAGPEEHFGLSVPTRAQVAEMYERALKFREQDPRVEIEPLQCDDFTVLKLHALYVRYLLPVKIEVQHFEWAPGFGPAVFPPSPQDRDAAQRSLRRDPVRAPVQETAGLRRERLRPGPWDVTRGTPHALDRPVLIIGSHRAGKSLVMRIIGNSPEFHQSDEPMMFWNIGMRHQRDDVRDPEEATDALRSEIVTKLAKQLARDGKTRYCEDLAHNMLRLPFVLRVLPNARVILVVRDPRDNIPEIANGWTFKQSTTTALLRGYQTRRRTLDLKTFPRLAWRAARNQFASQVRGRRESWGARPPGLIDFAATHSVAEIAAMQWQGLYETAFRDLDRLPDLPWMELRYEDLVSRPYEEAKRLAEFCEVEQGDRIAESAEQFIDPALSRGDRVDPTEEEWKVIWPRIEAVATRLGYAAGPA